MIRKLLSIALAGALLLAPHHDARAAAAEKPAAPAATPEKSSGKDATSRAELLQDAVTAVQETHNAMTAIDQNKPKDAIAALERATGKLEILLARTPTLALAPVDVSVVTRDVIANVEDVDELREAAEEELESGRLQKARHLIGTLASEVVISVSSVPLATYPAAIKSAAALLAGDKPQEAKAVLQTALNTLVVRDTILPLPLTRAQAAVEQARALSEKANRTPDENTRLRALLETAREQVRLGEALGYATAQDMTGLLAAIDEIDAKTAGQKHEKGLLDRIGTLFEKARNASQQEPGQPATKQ